MDVSHLPPYPAWVNQPSREMLEKSYIDDIAGGLRDQFKRMVECAAKWAPVDGTNWEQKFFDMMWKCYYSNSTPCLSNLGNPKKGYPISCSGSYMQDDLSDIFKTKHEIAMLTKKGFGTAVCLDAIRPRGALIAGIYPASGVLPIVTGLASDMEYVSQGNRRGSVASYLSLSHGDAKELSKYLYDNPKGLNIGWTVEDDYISKLESRDKESKDLYESTMLSRYVHGKGYYFFKDKANKYLPKVYTDKGLVCNSSQLCSEILLPNDETYTYSCVLGSLNVALYDEWKDTDLVKTAIVYLDCIASEFLHLCKGVEGFEKISKFTEEFRALGLGQMGLHTLMQNKGMVFGELPSILLNNQVARQIDQQSQEATKYLAEHLGEPEGCKGYGVRNGSRLAIAPTKSSSNIMGGVSQGIECYFGAAFVEPLSTGYVVRENPAFVKLLKEKGKYTKELMNDIATNYTGSIQHLDFLSDHEKMVFRAVYEINQINVLKLAAMRQKHLDQMQSINLTFGCHATPEEVSAVHKYAFKDPDILSLYYMRRVTEDKMGTHSKVDIDECLACQ